MSKAKESVIVLLIFFTFFSAISSFAQSSAAMENVEIEIIQERKITLPEAERKFNKIAPQASEPISPPITYSFRPFDVTLPLSSLTVRPLKLKKESEDPAFTNQISAAYGTYASPYLEALFTGKPRTNQLIGAHALMDVWSRGPIDKQNSGNGVYGLTVFAERFDQKISAGSYLSYNQTFSHFYGYTGPTPEASDIVQRYKRFALGGNFSNSPSSKVPFMFKADFGYLTDHFDAKETKVDIDWATAYKFLNETTLRINSSYQLLSRDDSSVEAKPRSLLKLDGRYSFVILDKLQVEAGLSFAYENDTIDKDFHVYPLLKANYPLSKKVNAKASLSGTINSVSLHSLSLENTWLAPNVAISHTNEAFLLKSSIEGKISTNSLIEAGASVASLRNLYFYSNLSNDQSRFELLYDESATERVNFFLLGRYLLDQKTELLIQADWFSYNTSQLAQAWHRPTSTVNLQASHTFQQKLKLSSGLMILGGMKAFDFETNKAVTLPTALDLSLSVDYFFSPKITAFVRGANLLSNDYSLYLGYPARGIQLRAGLSWNF